MSYGLILPADQFSTPQLIDLARNAEEAGIDI